MSEVFVTFFSDDDDLDFSAPCEAVPRIDEKVLYLPNQPESVGGKEFVVVAVNHEIRFYPNGAKQVIFVELKRPAPPEGETE